MSALRDLLADAMQNAWTEFVLDTGNYPDVLERRGSELVADFGVGNFAEMVASQVRQLIGDGHFVTYTEDRWTVEHSIDCRLSGEMSTCEYHAAIARVNDEPPDEWQLGRWRIVNVDSEGLPSLVRAPLESGDTGESACE